MKMWATRDKKNTTDEGIVLWAGTNPPVMDKKGEYDSGGEGIDPWPVAMSDELSDSETTTWFVKKILGGKKLGYGEIVELKPKSFDVVEQ